MSTLSIFIMCHNRPRETREVIRSVLAQSDRDFTLTISDNSTTDDVEVLVRSEFPQLHYVRHQPMTIDHINRCVEASTATHVCIFHDDDLMDPRFVMEMKRAIERFPQAAAIGCNAIIEEFGVSNRHPSFRARGDVEWIRTTKELAARYFSRHQLGIAPFPGYVYNRQCAQAEPFPVGGGKYADVTWLLKLARIGPIVWLNQPLMTYRLHGSNDGKNESRRDRLRFLRFVKCNLSWLGRDILDDYRGSFIYKPIALQNLSAHPMRQRIAQEFLGAYTLRRYCRLRTYTAAFRRAWVKALTTR